MGLSVPLLWLSRRLAERAESWPIRLAVQLTAIGAAALLGVRIERALVLRITPVPDLVTVRALLPRLDARLLGAALVVTLTPAARWLSLSRARELQAAELEARLAKNRGIELALGRAVQTLAPIQVTARFTAAGSLAAIEDRVRRNAGHLLTDRDISKRSPRRFEDLFRGVPGLMVARVPPADGLENFTDAEHAVSSRGIRSLSEVACAPSFLVDGTPINVDFSDAPFPVPISEVRALEMYPSTATAPFEFQRARSGCGVIVVWTKRGGAGP